MYVSLNSSLELFFLKSSVVRLDRQVDEGLVPRTRNHFDLRALLHVVQVVLLVRAAEGQPHAAPPLEAVRRGHHLEDQPRRLAGHQGLRIRLVEGVVEGDVRGDARLVVPLALRLRIQLPVPRPEGSLRDVVHAACHGVVILEVDDDVRVRVRGADPQVQVGGPRDLQVAVQGLGVHEHVVAVLAHLVVQQVSDEDHRVKP
mmetsp:Transcript_759/g.2225  ORF Transcript_759/g.2225 Transcript_759/m.2225 type:complete len:201 (+) Transcript_759:1658-2260(+)